MRTGDWQLKGLRGRWGDNRRWQRTPETSLSAGASTESLGLVGQRGVHRRRRRELERDAAHRGRVRAPEVEDVRVVEAVVLRWMRAGMGTRRA